MSVRYPLCALLWVAARAYATDDSPAPEWWNLHAQTTYTRQYHPPFNSPYAGANSLNAQTEAAETADVTVFAGVRLWHGAALYADEELDQGFGLSDTLGLAGFSSGEAYKVGSAERYYRMQRVFLRQVFALGGVTERQDSAANQLSGASAIDNVTLTLGKFSVVDIFDNNSYAHDPRADFMNWTLIDAGAFDYAADSWGYSYGGALEWNQGDWSWRGGVFNLSKVPNSEQLETDFSQFALVGEAEQRHHWADHDGKIKLVAFLNRGRFGKYDDALNFGNAPGQQGPNTANVRRYASRPGLALNLEQELSSSLGVFARASINDGSKEAYDFTDVDQSLALGASLKGSAWQRGDDTVGVAGAVNALSGTAQRYFAAGGMGILIGDSRLHYGPEQIVEAYYALHPRSGVSLSADYQYVVNPGYNRDRGPVRIFGLRLHLEY